MIEQGAEARLICRMADESVKERRTPSATYRLQMNKDFTFRHLTALVEYFHLLGISDLYLSPIFKARPGSNHGYDICDYNKINSEIGGEEELAALSAAAASCGMGMVLDVVPNHMGIDACNEWWIDVLENGPSSIYASYFDIDWDPALPEMKNKVLLPILEDQYGRALESGTFRLVFENGAFFIYHHETRLPVAPHSYELILGSALESLMGKMVPENPNLQELQSILTALGYLPAQTELDLDKLTERNREKEVVKRRITALYTSSPDVRAAIDSAVQELNGTVGVPRSFDGLDTLLSQQAYRPAFWRVAAEEINYRRFFDINDFAAIRVEVPEVLEATHALVFSLLEKDQFSGLRIDHADGLLDPTGYLRQLQFRYLAQAVESKLSSKGATKDDIRVTLGSWFARGRPQNWPLYIVVEKILSPGEPLPREWAVDGTTGYDFLNSVNGLFVAANNATAFSQLYGDFIGLRLDYDNLVNSSKKMTMLISLASEIYALSHQLERIAKKNRSYRDFTINSLTFAVREIIAALKIYRTYMGGPESVVKRDRAYIEGAAAEARKRNPRTPDALFDFVRDTLLLKNLSDFGNREQDELVAWVMKFQQITGPAMAKGIEDTAFYVFNRLLSLNEVGGSPGQFGTSVADFHEQNAERARNWPHSMLASTTHDTKRSEDVRARINVLSEMPERWQQALLKWRSLNLRYKVLLDGEQVPDGNEEYLLYQTLLGTWPLSGTHSGDLESEELSHFRDRVVRYMYKAINEAKVHSSWINLNHRYQEGVRLFVERVLGSEDESGFRSHFLPFQRTVAFYGALNGLSQLVLKLAAPGVPDLYQGSELWDLRLVDPDNRGPVDYDLRLSLLAALNTRIGRIDQSEARGGHLLDLARELLSCWKGSRIKLYVVSRTLNFRRMKPELFLHGDYRPIRVRGENADHACAFARILDGSGMLVVAPRLVFGLTGGEERSPLGDLWKDAKLELPGDLLGAAFRNLFTDETVSAAEENTIRLADVFANFPVAILHTG